MSPWSPPVVCRYLPASAPNHSPHLSLLLPPPLSSSIDHLALFSWSTAGLTTAVTSTADHVFHEPFYYPDTTSPSLSHGFLVRPKPTRRAALGLLPSSPLSRRPRPVISNHPRPSLIVVNVIRHRAMAGDDESCRHGWFTRRSSTACAGLLPATIIAISQVPLSLVCSLLDLPRPRSSLVYSSQRPSLPHQATTVTAVSISSRMPEQMSPPDFWLGHRDHADLPSPCHACQDLSLLPLAIMDCCLLCDVTEQQPPSHADLHAREGSSLTLNNLVEP